MQRSGTGAAQAEQRSHKAIALCACQNRCRVVDVRLSVRRRHFLSGANARSNSTKRQPNRTLSVSTELYSRGNRYNSTTHRCCNRCDVASDAQYRAARCPNQTTPAIQTHFAEWYRHFQNTKYPRASGMKLLKRYSLANTIEIALLGTMCHNPDSKIAVPISAVKRFPKTIATGRRNRSALVIGPSLCQIWLGPSSPVPGRHLAAML